MSLINEINIKKEFINAKSSLIEKLFYSFLTKKDIRTNTLPLKASNFEKIAYHSFNNTSFSSACILLFLFISYWLYLFFNFKSATFSICVVCGNISTG